MNTRRLTVILALIATCSVTFYLSDVSRAQKPLPAPPAASNFPKPEYREFKVSELHDLQFHALKGFISFNVGDISYVMSPSSEDSSAAVSAAILAEFRQAKRVKLRVSARPSLPPGDEKHFLLDEFILLYDDAP